MSGSWWEKVRTLWRTAYSSLMVVTIAESGTHSRSFSADTGMAECLVVGRKTPIDGENRAIFVILTHQPESTLHGELTAQVIRKAVSNGNMRRLEDGPFGGTRILLRETVEPRRLSARLPAEGPWQLVVSSLTLAQTAHQLSRGRLWIEGMAAARPVSCLSRPWRRSAPAWDHTTSISQAARSSRTACRRVPSSLSPAPRRRWRILRSGITTARASAGFRVSRTPVQIRQVRGHMCRPHPGITSRTGRSALGNRCTRTLQQDIGFNSQSTVVAMTEQPALGGRAWPTSSLTMRGTRLPLRFGPTRRLGCSSIGGCRTRPKAAGARRRSSASRQSRRWT